MKKPNLENIEKDIERKIKRREKKKKAKMKVDSANLKELRRIIIGKREK